MQGIIEQAYTILLKYKKTIAVAESCTGGLLASSLTSLQGSSRYFLLGIIPYSNQAKIALLGISPSLIKKHGAVSKAIAQRMAQNVRKIAHSEFGIGITGIAGPDGGSKEKPVGTVFIAVAQKNKTICRKFCFLGNRSSIRKKAALESLILLKNLICEG